MEQIGITYTLIGPDNTTITLDGAGFGSADWRLEDVEGLDSPNIRLSTEDLPEEDGAEFNPGFLGSRPVVLSGRSNPLLSLAARNAAMVALARASLALSADAKLRFQPDGMPALELKVRREQPLRFAGRGPSKEFLLSLVAADPRIYGQATKTAESIAIALLGAAFDWVFDVSFGGGSGAQRELAAANDGSYQTPPVFRITGPITSPRLKNGQSLEELKLTANGGLVLAAGEWVDVDMASRTVTRNTGATEYDKVLFPGTTWWYLNPGNTTVSLFGSAFTSATRLDATWRDAWA